MDNELMIPRPVEVYWRDGGPMTVKASNGFVIQLAAPIEVRSVYDSIDSTPYRYYATRNIDHRLTVEATTPVAAVITHPATEHEDYGRELAHAIRLALPALWDQEPHLAERIDDALTHFEMQFMSAEEIEKARTEAWEASQRGNGPSLEYRS